MNFPTAAVQFLPASGEWALKINTYRYAPIPCRAADLMTIIQINLSLYILALLCKMNSHSVLLENACSKNVLFVSSTLHWSAGFAPVLTALGEAAGGLLGAAGAGLEEPPVKKFFTPFQALLSMDVNFSPLGSMKLSIPVTGRLTYEVR